MTSHAEGGLRVTAVSLGKGEVAWKVDFPPFCRRDPRLKREWKSLEEALGALKRVSERDAVDATTADLADQRCPEITWGSDR